MSTLGYRTDENQNSFSRPMLMLGEIHWHLLRANYSKEEHELVKGGSLVDILEEMANSGREFIGDEIHWWVFDKETDLERLREKVGRALEAAHVLKKDSEALGYKEPSTLSDLHKLLKRFADDHSNEIEVLHQFVLWLASRDRLAPAILWTYRVWGSTKRANREFEFNASETQPSSETVKKMASIVLGFLSEGHSVESVAESELSSQMYESGAFEGEEIHVDETRLIRRASELAYFECAEYFDFIRHSLRNVLLEITKFTKGSDFADNDDFWRAFIEKAIRTPKAETQLWDFKETLTMWRVDKEPQRTEAKVTFGEDIAAFANARGGVLIVGVTDKREIVGIGSGRDLENNLKDAADVLPKYIEYPRPLWQLKQIVMPGKDGEKVCLLVVIQQACGAVGVHKGAGSYSYPVRRETGLTRVGMSEILRGKGELKADNLDFLRELYKFVHRSARPNWPKESGVYIAPSRETVPAFPSEWSGYHSNAGTDFWGKPFEENGTIRIFQGDGWLGIHKFPATMNGCSSGVFMIRWRSADLETPVESSLASYRGDVRKEDSKPAEGFGYMSGTNCDQPMFKFPDGPNRLGATLVDVYYDLKFWQAAP